MSVKVLWKAAYHTQMLTLMRYLYEQEEVCNERECLMRPEF
jgi:hypothetical protein